LSEEDSDVKKRFGSAADIKTAVVGYGPSFQMGRHHLSAMAGVGMVPTAVADIDPARLKAAAEEFPGIATYDSATAMLRDADVDLVTVVTPHNCHASLAVECLEAGRHVITEKPFAVTTAECDSMIEAASRNGVMLSTYHQRHWDGCILQAVELVRNQRIIGEVLRIEAHMGGYGCPGDWWRSSKSVSGGILYDWGAHLLEYSLQLLDGELAEISGFAHYGHWAPRNAWKEDTNEDEATAVVRLSSGQMLTLRISSIDANPHKGWLEITGTRGAYVFDGGTWRAIVHEGDGSTVVRHGPNPPGRNQLFYENIVAHLVDDEPLIITPEWARRPIHILDFAGQSALDGRMRPALYG
jgi:predicted dehydrogenase